MVEHETEDPTRDPGIVERTKQEGLGGLVKGLGSMLLPQAGLPGKRGLGNILNDFVEFGSLGDIGDVGVALDPNSGLDWLERLIAASPFLGVGAIGTHQAYTRYQKRHVDAQPQAAKSMMPPPGQPIELDAGFEEIAGPGATAEQTRQQAAHFEQAALEADSPFSEAIFRADEWGPLALAVMPVQQDTGKVHQVVDDETRQTDLNRMESALRGIGAAVRALAPDPKLYGSDFVAAKMAVAKWNRAIELGIIDTPIERQGFDANTRMTVELLSGTEGVNNAIKIAQLEAALWMVGPDLSLSSPARLSRVWWTEDTNEVQIGYAMVTGLLPVNRGFDYDTGYPIDTDIIRAAQGQFDMEGGIGVGATHVAQGLLDTPPHAADTGSGLDATLRMDFYPKMNSTARALSEITPYTVEQIMGVLAAMSAATPWIPDNLVGAVHVILQTGLPDLVPGSAEYSAAFKQVTLNAGWGFDLFEESSSEISAPFEQAPGAPGGIPDVEGITEFFGDPANVTSPEGNVVGAADQVKKDKIDMILKGNLPPWIVLRGMKTNTFSQVGANPSLVDLVTIDVWADRGWWGTRWVDSPLAHDGYTAKTRIQPEAVYHDPISGQVVKGEVILEGLETLRRDHGWTDQQVERWTRLLTSYPNKTAQARFLAQAKSYLLVRDEFGLEAGHQAQAGSWARFREIWGSLEKEIDSAKTQEELTEIAQRGNLSTIMFTHLDGNPSMELTAAGMIWNLTSIIPQRLPSLKELNAIEKGMQRPASNRASTAIIAIAGVEGQVAVYADASVNGVSETLRHATPTGVMVGPYELYISSEPRKVTEVETHFKDTAEYTREDGRRAAGHQTTVFDPGGLGHPGSRAGDTVVLLLPNERVDTANRILDADYGFDRTTVEARSTVTGVSRNMVIAEDFDGMSNAQVAEVLQNNDWVAISAFKEGATDGENWNNQRLLKLELERAGGATMDSEGVYDGSSERSFLVTGITYEDAFFLGRTYGQESIATRSGMFFMDGTYRPVQEGIAFGDEVDPGNHTLLIDTGHKFSFSYDWEDVRTLPGALPEFTMVSISSLEQAQNWTLAAQDTPDTRRKVEALAEKMKRMGQDAFWNNPENPDQGGITIGWLPRWNTPKLIDGSHRLEAAKLAGFTEVPVRFADKQIRDTRQWVPSQREAEIREILGMEKASNPEMETLVDVDQKSAPVTQMTIGMGGQYGGATWNITDRVLKQLAAIPGARLRYYTHSQNKIPSGLTPATESVVTDTTGVVGSTLHKGGDAYARHQNLVYIPEWEALTLSEDGFGGERTRRDTLDVKEILEIDEQAGMIWIDKDLAIMLDPEADVTMGKQGSLFGSLKVNGNLVRTLVVDTNGPVPIIEVGLDALPAPGRTVVELSRGRVTKIIPHGEGDWTAAKEALTGVGLIPEGTEVKVAYPKEQLTLLEDSTYRVNYEFGRGLVPARDQPSVRPVLPEDVELTERLQESIPKLSRVNLGKNAHPDLRGILEETLLGLHGIENRYPGVKVVGPINPNVWRGSIGIDTVHILNEPSTNAVTGLNKKGGITFNERTMHVRWNRGASRADMRFMIRPESMTDFEATLIHEMGHLASRHLHGGQMADLVTEAMDTFGGDVVAKLNMSEYGLSDNIEFIAEAFVEVMAKGEQAHPALVNLVRKVIDK